MAEDRDIAVLTFELLKKMQGQFNHIQADVGDLKVRMTAIEGHMGQLTGTIGHLEVQVANTNRRIDRIEERIGRIERRLDLTDA